MTSSGGAASTGPVGAMAMGSEPRRLHPASIGFSLMRQARALVIPGVVVLVASRGEPWQIWVMALFLPFAAYEMIRYFTLRYRVTPTELIVTSAFVGRSERNIPLARINNIDLVQSPLHRALRVAEVRIQTGAGAEPEAVLRVLSLEAVEQLRERLFAGRVQAAVGAGERAQPPEAQTLLALQARELVLLGLVSHRALAILAVGLGLAWELDLLDSDTFERVAPLLSRLTSPAAWAVGAAAAVVGLAGLSILWSFLRFWGFRLQRAGEDLRITAGLLTRTSATIPRRRIQVVAIHESILRRLLKRASVRVKTAGGASDGDQSGAAWFAPLIARGQVACLLEAVRPGLDLDAVAWRPLTDRARNRMIRRGVVTGLALWSAVAAVLWAIPGASPRSWLTLLGAALPALFAFAEYRSWRAARYSVEGGQVRARMGAVNRRSLMTFDDKAQVISVRQSPLDRLWKMASVRVDTAGAGFSDRIEIPMLDQAEAMSLADALGRRAERTGFRW
jgi:putative membrane protein